MTGTWVPAHPESLDGVDELSSRVFGAFIGALRLHRRLMMQALADRGVHPGQAMCLHLLVANDDIAQRDLAKAMHVAPPTLTRTLHSMEKAVYSNLTQKLAKGQMINLSIWKVF